MQSVDTLQCITVFLNYRDIVNLMVNKSFTMLIKRKAQLWSPNVIIYASGRFQCGSL